MVRESGTSGVAMTVPFSQRNMQSCIEVLLSDMKQARFLSSKFCKTLTKVINLEAGPPQLATAFLFLRALVYNCIKFIFTLKKPGWLVVYILHKLFVQLVIL